VFPNKAGKKDTKDHVRERFKNAAERAEVPILKFHATRHTWATLLLAAGVNPKLIQEMGGWASIAILLDTYTAYIPSMGADAVEMMERSQGGSEGGCVEQTLTA
jgi:integrase